VLLVLLSCLALGSKAQLPDGSIAPNFTALDISGKTHNLYQLLDSGKIVVLEFSATWCAPCWVYHNSHALQDFYQEFGPAGEDKVRVLWIEGDPNTNTNCLYGPAGCNGGSTGNYVAGTPYPIIDNAAVAALYKINYYPTLYVICPNRRLKEVKPVSADKIWEQAQPCPVAHGTHNAGIFQFDAGTELREICGTQTWAPQFALTNLGSAPLSNALVELKWNDQTLETLQWNGYLPTYGEATASFSAHPFTGEGMLKTTILNVNNGAGDDDFSNNVWNEAFSPAAKFSNNKILLRIRTDGYGEETYWELRNDAGIVLDKGGNELVGPNGGGKFPFGLPSGKAPTPT
jgi:Peroxiredoxin